MTNPFEELLHSLGKIFQLHLHIDHSNACSIRVHEELVIQIQPDMTQEHLWIFSKLIEIPPGKFREEVLKEALKANGRPEPLVGVLGYIHSSNHLALFQKYPINLLNGENLAGVIGAFLEGAEKWRTAIANGQPAPPSPRTEPSSNPFGLR